MKLLKALLCWFGLHAPPPGVKPKWSLYWTCTRCGSMRVGDLGRAVRRWRR